MEKARCPYHYYDDNDNIINTYDNMAKIFLFLDGGEMVLEVHDYSNGKSHMASAGINYCPICGEKLRGDKL